MNNEGLMFALCCGASLMTRRPFVCIPATACNICLTRLVRLNTARCVGSALYECRTKLYATMRTGSQSICAFANQAYEYLMQIRRLRFRDLFRLATSDTGDVSRQCNFPRPPLTSHHSPPHD
eukprot:scaffold28376_cov24-Prasinocladus_malaysianus.AAC.1